MLDEEMEECTGSDSHNLILLSQSTQVHQVKSMMAETLEGEQMQLLTEERPREGAEKVSILEAFFIQPCLLEVQTPLWKGQVTYFYQRRNSMRAHG